MLIGEFSIYFGPKKTWNPNIFNNMKPVRTFPLIILITCAVNIQGQIGWEWAYAEPCSLESLGTDVVQDTLGNIYITGYFGGQTQFGGIVADAVGSSDFFVAKLDPERNLLWFRQGGSAGYSYANGVVVDDSLNVYVTGSLDGELAAFLRKYDSAGNLKWEKSVLKGYHWEEAGKLITRTENEIIFATLRHIWRIHTDGSGSDSIRMDNTTLSNFEDGRFAAASNQEVVLLDKDLNELTSHYLPEGIELLHSVVLDHSYLYITGRFTGTMVMGDSILTGSHNMFVAKMDLAGQYIWANQGGGDTYDIGNDLAINNGNQLFVAGSYRNIAVFDSVTLGQMGVFEEIFVAEYNMDDGRLVDIISAGGDGDFEAACGLTSTVDNDLLVTGSLRDYYVGVSFGDILVHSPTGNIDFFLAKVSQPLVNARLSGHITADDIPAYSRVMLFRMDADSVVTLVGDKYSDPEGAFSFDVYSKGSYWVKAVRYTTEHISTYYKDAFLWNNGTLIRIESDAHIDTLDIDLIGLAPLTGSHRIFGTVRDDEDLPKRFVNTFLVTAEDTPVAFAQADTFGVYEFDNVPVGSYKILLDTLGVHMQSWYNIEITDLKSGFNENFSYDYLIQDGLIYATGVATGTDTRTECGSYTWIDGITYTESNNTASYTITGGASNGCDSIVSLDLTIINVNTGTTASGATITSDAEGASYRWLDCTNSLAVLPGETNRSFTAGSNGSYAVEVTQSGCTDISACTAITTMNETENTLEEQFMVYPNPTQGKITIEFEDSQEFLIIRLMSATGQVIEKRTVRNSGKAELDIQGPAGLYFMEISDSRGRKAALSILKQLP